MIKLFRHIRKNFLIENKTSKYFKYAVGEIILVVIRILIALSMNNWNEHRKNKIKEQQYLTSFKNLPVDMDIMDNLMSDRIFLNRVGDRKRLSTILNNLYKRAELQLKILINQIDKRIS